MKTQTREGERKREKGKETVFEAESVKDHVEDADDKGETEEPRIGFDENTFENVGFRFRFRIRHSQDRLLDLETVFHLKDHLMDGQNGRQ